MFRKILIANRGEIACRVAASARRMGILTVAVYSDADAGAKHVAACDEAVHIGAAAARESYLVGARIIEAARASGAQAIHPGYGFLSENAEFAAACESAGLVFIGPPAAAIRAMGSKSAAKTLMQGASVPLVPGYHGADQDAAHLEREANQIGYPVLIKASAGGGGKGMRIVASATEFAAALASCKREAAASFGDERVLVEKYLQRPRHIEVQVFADSHGQCLALFERDCSVQRRHQKVLEEAPAPGMTAERRAAMGAAAVAAARAVGYVGAGTVEFIANQDGSFYFMEMNTRLQVEHPVTEMITGFDLVEWQLHVAAGGALPVTQEQLRVTGHAIEARLYAENPAKGFLPATGTLARLRLPPAVAFCIGAGGVEARARAPLRIDSGVREGDTISPFYDPMIAKMIAWGETREIALARLSAALRSSQVMGVATNVEFLSRLVNCEPFASAQLDTGLIERNHDELLAPRPDDDAALALAIAALLDAEARTASTDPWDQLGAFRLNLGARRPFEFETAQGTRLASLLYRDGICELSVDSPDSKTPSGELRVLRVEGELVTLNWAGTTLTGDVVRRGAQIHVFHAGRQTVLTEVKRADGAHAPEGEQGTLMAPMPGKIVAVSSAAGARVKRGDALIVMEAMKMEHTLFAPADGVVREVLFAVGEQVGEGALLIDFQADGAGS
jgi:3-methylcrotonyl-CoA carboxylase alpha subunit